MSFNPVEHMMKLKGKDYLQVAWRLVWFREDHPDWSISTAIIENNEDHAIFRALISDENGSQKSTGHGSESKRDFGDFLEKAETKAVGRALAMLGYGTQFAADELDEGERIVDSPIDRTNQAQQTTPEPLPEPPQESFGYLTKAQVAKMKAMLHPDEWSAMETKYGVGLAFMSPDIYETVFNKIKAMKKKENNNE